MNADNGLILSDVERLERRMYSPPVLVRFENLLNEAAKPYIESVLILAAQRPELQKCTPESIIDAAMTAAALRLSCNPVLKQAHLLPIPRRRKDGDRWVTWYEAVFYPHYLGLYLLAIRSGNFKALDVLPTPPGCKLVHDIEKGDETLIDAAGNPLTKLERNIPQVGGWYAFFVMNNGFTKRIHMTIPEIHQRARKMNPSGYDAPRSQWKDPKGKGVMEMKTVLRELLNWADKNGMGSADMRAALGNAEIVDGTVSEEALPPGVDAGVDRVFS